MNTESRGDGGGGQQLEEAIKKLEIDEANGGGYYVLKTVKYAANVQVDIFILKDRFTDENIKKKFILYNNMSLAKRIKRGFLRFLDIKAELDGYARIIYYTTNDLERAAGACSLIKI